ncbi:putative phage DNA-directed RNA polymerase beta subunit 2 [Salmonella phage SPFM20]|nr:putative phage DNA-directed RNA polymerase beta subunit 2 [Salmonella phage SPFM20]
MFAYYLGLTGMLKHFGISYAKAPREMTELSLMGKSISLGLDKDKTEPLGTLAEVFGVDTSKKPRSHVIVGMDKNSQLYRAAFFNEGQLADADRVELVPVGRVAAFNAIGYQWNFDIKQKELANVFDPLSKLPRQYTEVALTNAIITRAVDPKNTEITDATYGKNFVRRSDKVVNDYGRWRQRVDLPIRKVSHDTVALTTVPALTEDGTWVANGVEYTMRQHHTLRIQPIGGEPTTVRFSIGLAIHNHTVEKEISVTGNIEYNQEIFPKDVLGAVASSQRLERLVTDEAWAENTTDQIIRHGEGLTIDPKKLEVKAEPKKMNESSKRFVNLPNPYNPKET